MYLLFFCIGFQLLVSFVIIHFQFIFFLNAIIKVILILYFKTLLFTFNILWFHYHVIQKTLLFNYHSYFITFQFLFVFLLFIILILLDKSYQILICFPVHWNLNAYVLTDVVNFQILQLNIFFYFYSWFCADYFFCYLLTAPITSNCLNY